MKKILAVVLAVALSSSAVAAAKRYFYETQNVTRAAPTGTPGFDSTGLNPLGLGLQNVIGYQVSVCAVGGYNLTSGSLRAYMYHDVAQAWMRNKDLDLTIAAVGNCQAFSQPSVPAGVGGLRVLYAADTIVVSQLDGGAVVDGGVIVRLDGKLKTE